MTSLTMVYFFLFQQCDYLIHETWRVMCQVTNMIPVLRSQFLVVLCLQACLVNNDCKTYSLDSVNKNTAKPWLHTL